MSPRLRLLVILVVCVLASCSKAAAPKKKVVKGRKKPVVVQPVDEPETETPPASKTEQVNAGLPASLTEPEMRLEAAKEPVESAITKAPDLPALELVKHNVKLDYDEVKYVLFAPADAKIKADQDAFTVSAGPRFNMKIELGRHDLKHLASTTGKLENVAIVKESPDTLIFRTQTIALSNIRNRMETHQFFMNRTFGYRDFKISSSDFDLDLKQCFSNSTDNETMRKAGEQFALAEPLPEDPSEILKLMDVTLHRNDAKEIYWVILPAIGTTEATLPLLAKIPTIVDLQARSMDVNPGSWSFLKELSKLERLDVSDNALGTEGMSIISGLKQLKKLGLGEWKMPMSDIQQVEKLESLESLAVASNEITDASMDQFPALPNLKELALDPCRVDGVIFTGIGLGKLTRLPKLDSLKMSQSKITDEAFQGISKLTTLKKLSLRECEQLTGTGVAQLVTLSGLETLEFSHSKNIDDAAVDTLCKLKTLKELSVDGTKITDSGHAKLKAALPDCTINYK